MKVVCIEPLRLDGILVSADKDLGESIKYGGIYDVFSSEISELSSQSPGIEKYLMLSIIIIDEFGKPRAYRRSRFITLGEWRDKQLNEIGV